MSRAQDLYNYRYNAQLGLEAQWPANVTVAGFTVTCAKQPQQRSRTFSSGGPAVNSPVIYRIRKELLVGATLTEEETLLTDNADGSTLRLVQLGGLSDSDPAFMLACNSTSR
jgi:hypothetical protein